MTYYYVSREGEYFAGIPARDITDEEYVALNKEQRRLVRESGLYQRADNRRKKKEILVEVNDDAN